jgi:hypothetical protein
MVSLSRRALVFDLCNRCAASISDDLLIARINRLQRTTLSVVAKAQRGELRDGAAGVDPHAAQSEHAMIGERVAFAHVVAQKLASKIAVRKYALNKKEP